MPRELRDYHRDELVRNTNQKWRKRDAPQDSSRDPSKPE